MPVAAGANKAQLEQVVSGLTPGQVLPVYVHVTMQPAKADRPLQIKLKGGQFRAEDRRIVLTDLTVGDGTPADTGRLRVGAGAGPAGGDRSAGTRPTIRPTMPPSSNSRNPVW